MSGIYYQRCATPRRADSSSSHRGCTSFRPFGAFLRCKSRTRDGGRSMSMIHSHPVLDANAHAKSIASAETDRGWNGHGRPGPPRGIPVQHPPTSAVTGVELKTLLQATLARRPAVRTKYGDAAENSPVSITRKHAAGGEGRSITPPFSWHCASAGSGRAGGGCRCAGSGRCR